MKGHWQKKPHGANLFLAALLLTGGILFENKMALRIVMVAVGVVFAALSFYTFPGSPAAHEGGKWRRWPNLSEIQSGISWILLSECGPHDIGWRFSLAMGIVYLVGAFRVSDEEKKNGERETI